MHNFTIFAKFRICSFSKKVIFSWIIEKNKYKFCIAWLLKTQSQQLIDAEQAKMKQFRFARCEIISNIGCEKQETADHTAVRKDTRSRTIRAKKRVYVQRYNNMPPSIRGHGYVSKTWDSVWKYWSIVQLKNWAIDNNPMPAITHEHTNVV